MTIRDLLDQTSTGLLSNKVRTGLTMLGIVIGVASVIAMLAIGNGSSNTIQAKIESIGSNLVEVTPGAPRSVGTQVRASSGSAKTLTMDDVTAISSQIPDAEAVAASVTSREQVVAPGMNTNTSIIGVTPAYLTVRDVSVDTGTFFTDDQVTSLAKVAVLGPTTEADLFAADVDPIGQTIRINGNVFTVIGITTSKGGSAGNTTDDEIYIPLTVAQQYFIGNQYVSNISIEAKTSELVTNVQNEVTALLLQRHNISDPTKADFSTLNQSDILSTASSITGTMTALLAAIAGISLLVGGIGIMNMMLTTVTERTREIGLRKAIGAKKGDIRLQFLIESMMLTIIGGIIGIILGMTISWVLTITGMETADVSLVSVILAFGVSAIIGIVFGYYPAARASNLNPIEALRYE
jgi:putative ABC transport system permease protein